MKMNEIEIEKQSFDIQEVADNVIVCDNDSLNFTFEMIKAIRKHKQIIIEYWKNAKESAKKAYQDISSKEKEMLEVCETSEKLLKDKILKYKQTQDEKQKKLILQAENKQKNRVEEVLNEAINLESQGKYEEARLKLAESEKLERISLSLGLSKNQNKINTQNRFKCKVTDNKLVPCFFDGIEIREINTKKLLEIRKKTPEVKISGVEFYQDESVVIRL